MKGQPTEKEWKEFELYETKILAEVRNIEENKHGRINYTN